MVKNVFIVLFEITHFSISGETHLWVASLFSDYDNLKYPGLYIPQLKNNFESYYMLCVVGRKLTEVDQVEKIWTQDKSEKKIEEK